MAGNKAVDSGLQPFGIQFLDLESVGDIISRAAAYALGGVDPHLSGSGRNIAAGDFGFRLNMGNSQFCGQLSQCLRLENSFNFGMIASPL